MTIQEQRQDLIDWIMNLDDPKVLRRLAFVRETQQGEVDITQPGPALSPEAFKQELERLYDEGINGKLYTQEEVEKLADKW